MIVCPLVVRDGSVVVELPGFVPLTSVASSLKSFLFKYIPSKSLHEDVSNACCKRTVHASRIYYFMEVISLLLSIYFLCTFFFDLWKPLAFYCISYIYRYICFTHGSFLSSREREGQRSTRPALGVRRWLLLSLRKRGGAQSWVGSVIRCVRLSQYHWGLSQLGEQTVFCILTSPVSGVWTRSPGVFQMIVSEVMSLMSHFQAAHYCVQ